MASSSQIVDQTTSNQSVSLSTLSKHEYFKHNTNDELFPFGFNNIGSNCWLNTMLQALMSCTGFNKYMEENVDSFVLNPVGQAYLEILNENEPDSSIKFLSSLIKTMKKPNSLRLSGQQCTHEGLTKFIECLSQVRIDRMFEWIYRAEIECPSCGEKSITRDINNSVQHVVTYDMPVDKFVSSLRNREVVATGYTCEKCKVKSDTTRKENLVRAGEIICVTMEKASIIRQFPEKFEITSSKGNLKYMLVAIVDHYGSYGGGHYMARVLRQGKWFLCNDIQVSPSNPKSTGSESMLMYEMY